MHRITKIMDLPLPLLLLLFGSSLPVALECVDAALLPPVVPHTMRGVQAQQPRAAVLMRRAEESEPDPELDQVAPGSVFSVQAMSELASRMSKVKESDELRQRLEALPTAWVLVFDHETEEETVYSMELADQEQDIVIAFENEDDAAAYASSIAEDFEPSPSASVQALDLEALVVSSREADFRVAVIFKGDLDMKSAAFEPLITMGASIEPELNMRVSFTLVPEDMFSEKSSADFIDPAEEKVWALIQDAGTGDSQFFSITVNGTQSIICFKDEAAARHCCEELRNRGTPPPTPSRVLLEEVLDAVDELESDELEVCLVDEVVSTLAEDGANTNMLIAEDRGGEAAAALAEAEEEDAQQDSLAEIAVAHVERSQSRSKEARAMLNRLYSSGASADAFVDDSDLDPPLP